MLLKDKVVIVSGIGPGLGIELALCAAREGAAGLVLAARTPARLSEAAERVHSLGLKTRVLEVPTDIADPHACEQLAQAAFDAYGKIDGLINSAYVPGSFGSWDKWRFDDWRKTMDVNLFGSLQLSRAVAGHMKNQEQGGAIVMVNSMVTKQVIGNQAGYATSKGALTVATKALATELAPLKIRINSCYMGWMWGASVKTYCEMAAPAMNCSPEDIKKGIEKNIPLGVMPEDRECAPACIFLLSDYAKVITGAQLDVNGGEYMPQG
jgi:NAD(P)-dependent dehydrogenase (short-subunit alcohol dehydrogenase family)